jgi:valyl-tRNA synthetase
VVEVADRHAAAHMLGACLAQYEIDQDPTKLVYPVWRDPDVLDTWFSSGLWPIGTLGWPEETDALQRYFPTSTLISGFDIIFFWVARMMMMQLAVTGEVPFRDVYVHALVRDEKGRKMSKSVGNVLDPLELVDEYGADALRFTLTSMAAMGRDLKLSKDRIQGYRNFGTKLWNAARFAEMNDCKPVDGFDPPSVTQTVNKWIVGETARARMAHDEALGAVPVQRCGERALRLVWHKVCDWYLEFAKPLFASGRRGGDRRDARDHGLGHRPVPDPSAPHDALHHRGALGRDRHAAQDADPCRLARLRRGADRRGGGPGDDLGHRPDRRDPLGPRADACAGGAEGAADAGRAG